MRREPRGDPGAGGVGVRGTRLPTAPGSGIETPLRASGARRRVPIRRYRLVKGENPPFTLSPELAGSEQSSLPSVLWLDQFPDNYGIGHNKDVEEERGPPVDRAVTPTRLRTRDPAGHGIKRELVEPGDVRRAGDLRNDGFPAATSVSSTTRARNIPPVTLSIRTVASEPNAPFRCSTARRAQFPVPPGERRTAPDRTRARSDYVAAGSSARASTVAILMWSLPGISGWRTGRCRFAASRARIPRSTTSRMLRSDTSIPSASAST